MLHVKFDIQVKCFPKTVHTTTKNLMLPSQKKLYVRNKGGGSKGVLRGKRR